MEFNPYPDPFVYPPQTEQDPAAEAAGAGQQKLPSASAPPPEFPSVWGSTRVTQMPGEQASALSTPVESQLRGQSHSQAPQTAPHKTEVSTGPTSVFPEPDFSEFEAEETPTRSLAGVIGFFVIVGLIIGGWYYFSSRGAPKQPPTKTPDSQPNLIAASLGGTIKNGDATIIIPPGALTSDMEIFIKRVAEGTQENATDLYHLEPHGYNFLKPVTVIIPYKKYPSRLKYTQNGTTKYAPFTIDAASKTIRIEVMEF